MNRPPAFQFYPKDWLDFKVQRMSLAAQGVYLKLLCFMWTDSRDQCSILDDDGLLARALGITLEQWGELRTELQHEFEPLFEQKDGRFVSARLRHEALKQRKYAKAQSERAHKRWDATAMPRHSQGNARAMPESCSSSSSSSSLKNKKKTMRTDVLNGHQSGFDIFWNIYPKKRGKGQAEKVWAKLQPDEALLTTMLDTLEQAKQAPDWVKDSGKFIPHPATWLNAKGWQDEFLIRKERLPL